MNKNLNTRVVDAITSMMGNNKQFTIADVTSAVRHDGGESSIAHATVREIARPILDNLIVKHIGSYAVAPIVVEVDGTPMQANLYYPSNTNPEDYKNKTRSSAAAERAALYASYTGKAIIDIVADRLGKDVNTIFPETDIVVNLGADSLDVAELTMDIEDKFGIKIPDPEVIHPSTIKNIVDYINNKKSQQTSTKPVVVAPTQGVPSCAANAKWWAIVKPRSDGSVEVPKIAFKHAFANGVPTSVYCMVHPNSISLTNNGSLSTKYGVRINKTVVAKTSIVGKYQPGMVVVCAFTDKIVIC